MKTGKDFINDLWEDMTKRKFVKPKKHPDLETLKKTEWSEEFEKLMRNRLVMGSFRYGLIKDQDYSKYDLPGEAMKRINLYIKDKNLEHLVDAANILLLAFIHGKRLKHKFIALDDKNHSEEK